MARSKIPRICKVCQKPFLGWTGNPNNYCSKACYHADDRPRAIERFWMKVDRTGDCWLWTGPKAKNGYGKTGVGPAHKLAWSITNGPIPKGLSILHHCDNPPCCRPEHLFAGTTADNSADMVRKGRSLKGEKHPMAVVNESLVRQIRALYVPRKNGGLDALGKQFGVAPSTVHAIVTRKIWKHLD